MTADQKIDLLLDLFIAAPQGEEKTYELSPTCKAGFDWLNSFSAGHRITLKCQWGIDSLSVTDFMLVEHRGERFWVSLDGYGDVFYNEELCDTADGLYKLEAWEA